MAAREASCSPAMREVADGGVRRCDTGSTVLFGARRPVTIEEHAVSGHARRCTLPHGALVCRTQVMGGGRAWWVLYGLVLA